LKRFLKKRFLGIPFFAILAVLLATVVAAASVIISNLWTSPNIVVTPPPIIISSADFTEDRNIYIDEVMYASVNTKNTSEQSYTDVLFEFTIYKNTTIATDDAVLEYSIVTDEWLSLPLTLDDGKLVGSMVSAYPISAGYDWTTQIKATFTTAGIYHAEVQAVGN